MLSTAPVLKRTVLAGEALGLEAFELLHAGPPLADSLNPPAVLMSSAVMTALHEGWACSEADAERLVRRGTIKWRCAQDVACVTPLAATVSQNTPLFEVCDAAQSLGRRYSLVSPVLGADTRMGNRDPQLPARLRARDTEVAPAWQQWLNKSGPLALWPIANAGLNGGDDLHFRTNSASVALGEKLAKKGSAEWSDAIGRTPTYFLTLWMAACMMLLEASSKAGPGTTVVRAGANGECFGMTLADNPNNWLTDPATPPEGSFFADPAGVTVCPAIGDSAVIDFAGFGGQGLQLGDEARESFSGAGVLPADYAEISKKISLVEHDALNADRGIGTDARKVADTGATPLVALAMLDAKGQDGLLGRGLYRTNLSLFEQALK